MNQTPDITAAIASVRRAIIALTVATSLALASLVLTVAVVLTEPDGTDAVVVREGVRIEEDDPRWDCARHGNRICGPVG